MIPLIIVEEHHEVLYAWHKLRFQLNWNPSELTLLHVDQHADMELPTSIAPIRHLLSKENDILSFIQSNFSIDNFIQAAIAAGFFSKTCWICRDPANAGHVEQRFIATAGADDLHLIGGLHGKSMREKAGSLYTHYLYRTARLPHELLNNCSVLLDIDLDYFSSERWATPVHTRIEIPLESYEEIRSNPYHFLRLLVGAAFQIEKVEEKYFLCFHENKSKIRSPIRSSEVEILRHIDELAESLKKSAITPIALTLARSCFSGYTPSDQWQWIESEVIKMLELLYPIKIYNLKEFSTV